MKKASSKAADMPRVQLSARDFARGRDTLIEIVLENIGENGEDGVTYMKKLGTRDALDFANLDQHARVAALLPLVMSKLCHADGSLVFDPNDPEAVEIAENMDPQVFDKLSDCITEQMTKAKSREDKEKNV